MADLVLISLPALESWLMAPTVTLDSCSNCTDQGLRCAFVLTPRKLFLPQVLHSTDPSPSHPFRHFGFPSCCPQTPFPCESISVPLERGGLF